MYLYVKLQTIYVFSSQLNGTNKNLFVLLLIDRFSITAAENLVISPDYLKCIVNAAWMLQHSYRNKFNVRHGR